MNMKGIVLETEKSIWICNNSCSFNLLVLGRVWVDDIGGYSALFLDILCFFIFLLFFMYIVIFHGICLTCFFPFPFLMSMKSYKLLRFIFPHRLY